MPKAPTTTRAMILDAMRKFDADLRGSEEWSGWQDRKNHKFAINAGGILYPVKTVLSLATGVAVSEFSGGAGSGQANQTLERLGFEVVQIHRRNPSWSRDELILALDLYLRHRHKLPAKESKEVQDLSILLGRLAKMIGISGDERLRNINGVYMKLMNFRALDPLYTASGGVGLSRGGHEDLVVWETFADPPDRCHQLAEAIRAAVVDDAEIPIEYMDGLDDLEEAKEGRVLTVQHRRRERNREIVNRKKRKVLSTTGRLACEVCGFDFFETYGDRGQGFIECHHTKPLAESAERKTKLADLALVCANCHRMIHAKKEWLSIEALRKLLQR